MIAPAASAPIPRKATVLQLPANPVEKPQSHETPVRNQMSQPAVLKAVSQESAGSRRRVNLSLLTRDTFLVRRITTHTAKGRLRTRRFNPAGFPLAFAARGAMLTGEPFNPTFFGTDGITSEPNRVAHRSSKRL
jgi:hypothetical protein